MGALEHVGPAKARPPMSEDALDGLVVVVTGVTGYGLGAALADLLGARGACVVGAGRREAEGEAWAQTARRDGTDALFVRCDVSRVEDCRRLIESAVERYGRIDGLINNAGVVGDPPLLDSHLVEENWWDRVIDINLKGAFFCARYALEHMIAHKSGVIVNIASRRALVPGPKMVAYAASKAGMLHMGVSLAEELRGSGVRVNNVVMGGVVGESSAAVTGALREADPAAYAALMATASGGAARGGLLEASVAAEAVVALLEPPCRAVSGATLAVG